MIDDAVLQRAADALASAEALLVGAGAGMGVDSGLPDFRGDQGFWKAYPAFARLGLRFIELANPRWFRTDPSLAWGFYGHRLNLYRTTRPHAGFDLLHSWMADLPFGGFVFTSNVDGQFQRAGFDPARIVEVHGAIDWLQCTRHCGIGVFSADGVQIVVDEATMRAQEPLPTCPGCGALARPNILMFGDFDWDERRTAPQEARLHAWLEEAAPARLVIVECGAGTAIPSVRRLCEHVAYRHGGTLIRINPREPDVPPGHLSVPTGALQGLRALAEQMQRRGV